MTTTKIKNMTNQQLNNHKACASYSLNMLQLNDTGTLYDDNEIDYAINQIVAVNNEIARRTT